MTEIHQYTLQLEQMCDSLKCQSCSKCDQFVSHGFVYKKQHQGDKEKVGKRIFCTNRYCRSGCGSTFRLYLCTEIPILHFGTAELLIFLRALLSHASIGVAYEKATGTVEPRNAYRWLNKLKDKLIDYRQFLKVRHEKITTAFKSRGHRLKILLPTLQRVFSTFTNLSNFSNPCASYQISQPDNFI